VLPITGHHPPIPSCPTSPAIPPLPSSSNTGHSMLTRQKTNSRRPKEFLNFQIYSTHITTTSLATADTELTCYTQAVKSAH
jgi:hypothetical protein